MEPVLGGRDEWQIPNSRNKAWVLPQWSPPLEDGTSAGAAPRNKADPDLDERLRASGVTRHRASHAMVTSTGASTPAKLRPRMR